MDGLARPQDAGRCHAIRGREVSESDLADAAARETATASAEDLDGYGGLMRLMRGS